MIAIAIGQIFQTTFREETSKDITELSETTINS